MNYYEHHLGDYAKDVGALPLAQEGAYRRLLDRYYATEKPLPGTLDDCCEIVVVRNAAETTAVATVLRKFFVLRGDGLYHQKRADEEIARYQRRDPLPDDVNAPKQPARLARHREERAALFALVQAAGFHADRNAGVGELRRLVAAIEGQARPPPEALPRALPGTLPGTAEVTPEALHETLPGTLPGTAGNASVTLPGTPFSPTPPLPLPQSPIPDTRLQNTAEARASAASASASPAGAACMAMRAAGIADVNPSNPTLLTMLEQGARVDEFHFAAVKAVQAKKGFAYALAVVKGAREDAAAVALAPISKTNGAARFTRKPGAPSVLDGADRETEAGHVHAAQTRD